MKGTVYKSTGSWYQVKSEAGTFYDWKAKMVKQLGEKL